LDPEFGQRGGFLATSKADHRGSYVDYNSKFEIFKECIEMPYIHYNFRRKASTVSNSGLHTKMDETR
jgi:hypothetical protein